MNQKCLQYKEMLDKNLFKMKSIDPSGIQSIIQLKFLHKQNEKIIEKIKEYACDIEFLPKCYNPPCDDNNPDELQKIFQRVYSRKQERARSGSRFNIINNTANNSTSRFKIQ